MIYSSRLLNCNGYKLKNPLFKHYEYNLVVVYTYCIWHNIMCICKCMHPLGTLFITLELKNTLFYHFHFEPTIHYIFQSSGKPSLDGVKNTELLLIIFSLKVHSLYSTLQNYYLTRQLNSSFENVKL